MNKYQFLVFFALVSALLSCNQKKERGENYTFGNAKIVSDESLFPIVDDEHLVFQTRYKKASIEMVYKPLKEALSLFLNDSIDVAVLPRQLTEEEKAVFAKKNVKVRTIKFAIDGIAVITSKSNPTEKITIDEIKAYLNGTTPDNAPVVVFDNAQSSTVEYLMENLNVKELNAKNIYALKTSEEVIRYVKDHPKAYGIISVSWIKRPTKDIEEAVNDIKCLAVKNKEGSYVEPTQSSLKTQKYPLTRDLYLIDCQGKAGLGTGFAAFLASDIGQRIILKSGIAPDSLPSRQIIIRK
ncbi:ABC-type phosphate transport system periplasmic component-like protein [Pseudopedobacter saltans DSM 12145]|uniref:ABC-type phosphate transport system periplasmic component-like protein n=1 Tax=Pseudopedobacter saltans (strain ATCC 51119 / DSM 12145 / JCM 21818 / CCUG 39354 / LMG 10337 / NBRC 100064 / NCIMB 13643) TaxID=762903 RepID=F0S914_PSESL|nr:substrate-binding domain-containing protein [Pseudopedobacter saltans]ADY53501.1 ABC-type phosphate transport system periplasmic component-like protein [Pseudopedobacter saltans DSM 12145]